VSATSGPAAELRVVLADHATEAAITVILPAAACTVEAAASHRRLMASARAAFTDSCGPVRAGASVRLVGTATVLGVGFFARSRTEANDGFALAPVLRFSASGCRQAGG
jgi:hypothetical protein